MIKIQDIPYKFPAFFTMDSTEMADFQITQDNIEFVGNAVDIEYNLKFYAIYKYENIYDYKFIIAINGNIDWTDINGQPENNFHALCLYTQRWDKINNTMQVFRHLTNHSIIMSWLTGKSYNVSSLYQYVCDMYGIKCDSHIVHIDEETQHRDITECQSVGNYIKVDVIEGGGGIHTTTDANIRIMDRDPVGFVMLDSVGVIDNTSWLRTVLKNKLNQKSVRLDSLMFKFINKLNNIPMQNARIYYYFDEIGTVRSKIENISFWSGFGDMTLIYELGYILRRAHEETSKELCDGVELKYVNDEVSIEKYFKGNKVSELYITLPLAELINPMLHVTRL